MLTCISDIVVESMIVSQLKFAGMLLLMCQTVLEQSEHRQTFPSTSSAVGQCPLTANFGMEGREREEEKGGALKS